MRRLLASLALTLLAILGGAPAALADPPTSIVVEDTAGVLYQPQLLPALEDLDFREPTQVVIYTRNGDAGDNFNEEVLRYAREEHPEWITADDQKWADGLFIFAFDPAGRQVGTYMGEDRKVSLSKQEAIQDSAKDLFREAQWTDGTLAGVKKGAKLINQPWYQSAAFIITTSIVGGLALLGFGTWATVRAVNRNKAAQHIKRGDAGYSNVSLALDVTELNAKTIPESSPYGALVLEKYRNFSNLYNRAGSLNQKAHGFTKKELSHSKNVKVAKQYAELASQLDDLDDVIADTNTLLNKYAGWGGAWDRQAKPLAEDLKDLTTLISQREAKNVPTTAALASFQSQKNAELQALAADFQAERLTPEEALDRLKALRKELTNLLQQHSSAMINKYAKTTAEKDKMRKSMEKCRRNDPRMRQNNILGAVYGWNTFYSVHSFSSGYQSGKSAVDSSRGSSGSGSSTGYGSSGGSFSGSGSSSSF